VSGIVRMLDSALAFQTDHEIDLKEQEYLATGDGVAPPEVEWRSQCMDALQIRHRASLTNAEGRLLEIGCGDGRFTVLYAQVSAEVLAVDSSEWALRRAHRNLAAGEKSTPLRPHSRSREINLRDRVGLVQADASHFRAAPRSFNRVLSATPLHSLAERMHMYSAIAEALTNNGRYVCSVEYDDLYRRFFGRPVRRYSHDGILIEVLKKGLRRELEPYFNRLRIGPAPVRRPSTRVLSPSLRMAAERLALVAPGVRHKGEILLVCAEGPRRQPQESIAPRRPLGLKNLFRLSRTWLRRAPVWTSDDVHT
jgi:ubiquinone/menaquinone biosynthesis C-methylase UbiE